MDLLSLNTNGIIVSVLLSIGSLCSAEVVFEEKLKTNGQPFVRVPLAHRIPLGQWRRVKFEIRGNAYKCFLGESAGRMELAGQGRGVSFELEYPAGETSYATIAGLGPNLEVKAAGRVLARTDNLDAAKEGWKSNAEGLLLLKLQHDEHLVRVSVAEK